jgi:inorganic pyrophosphatase
MNISTISAGKNAPHEVNVIIEIPAHTGPVKYEFDKDSGMLLVDRFLSTAMFYPCNYGFIPKTLAADGDPADVLVMTPSPLISGAIITVRPVGLLKMTDEKGADSKILAVPINKLTRYYDNVNKPQDLPEQVITSITHFFEHYKDLEHGKWAKVEGWEGADAAHKEILTSMENYQSTTA